MTEQRTEFLRGIENLTKRAFDFKQSYWKRQPLLTLKRNSSPSVALPSYPSMAMESKATLLVWWGTSDEETMV